MWFVKFRPCFYRKKSPIREVLFEGVGQAPLDVTTQGDDGAFPGTIWVGDVASGAITVFEPAGPEDGD
jgi:hypothetical protein